MFLIKMIKFEKLSLKNTNMKKYNFLLVVASFFLFYVSTGNAQNRQLIDSLKLLIQRTNSNDVKIRAYKDISWEYAITRTKLDSARFYADSIKFLSIKTSYQRGLAHSHFSYGLINRFEGKYYEGLNHLDKYLVFYQKTGDSLKMTSGLFQKGVIHQSLGNYVEALDIYYRILNIYKNNNMQNSVANTLNAIGHIQRKVNKQTDAIENYKQAIIIDEQLEDMTGISMNFESIGNTYGELKQYSKAEYYLLKSLDMERSEKNSDGIASVTENLGNLYMRTGKYQKALNFYLESLDIRKRLPSKRNLAIGYSKLGVAYLKLNNIHSAKKHLFESLDLAKKIEVTPLIIDNYKALTELNELTNNISEAFKYQKLYMEAKDSMFTIEKNKQLIELETKYQTAQKNKEIQLLTKENQLQEAKSEKEADLRKSLIAGLFLLTIIGGLLFYSMRQRLRNQKMLVEKNEEIKRSQYREQLQTLEMKALRAQMNPHFLFNSLNSINTMILSDENDNASKYLSKFSKLVRLMLENSEQSQVSLKDEISMLETYVQLEALRFNNKIEYKIEVDKTIDQDDTYLPSMVLQPFVENAIWHGLLHNDKKGLLTIIIKEDAENLYCSIIDNGIGRDKSLTLQKEGGLKKKSMGIKITTERLRLLTQQKINEVIAIIDLKDENNNAIGTQVNIQIPLS